MAIFRRMAKIGEGPAMTCTFGLPNLTYGGWFVPKADAFFLGTLYLWESPDDHVWFSESPSNAVHFIEGVAEDIYEV